MAGKLEACFLIKSLRPCILFIDHQTYRIVSWQEVPSQTRQAAKSVALATLLSAHKNSFDESRLGSLRNHVNFENRSAVLSQDPNSALSNTSFGSLLHSPRVLGHWIDPALF